MGCCSKQSAALKRANMNKAIYKAQQHSRDVARAFATAKATGQPVKMPRTPYVTPAKAKSFKTKPKPCVFC